MTYCDISQLFCECLTMFLIVSLCCMMSVLGCLTNVWQCFWVINNVLWVFNDVVSLRCLRSWWYSTPLLMSAFDCGVDKTLQMWNTVTNSTDKGFFFNGTVGVTETDYCNCFLENREYPSDFCPTSGLEIRIQPTIALVQNTDTAIVGDWWMGVWRHHALYC